MTALEIAREYFPEMNDDDLDYIIWEHTGFPIFWPDTSISTEANLRAQLVAFKAMIERATP